MKPQQSVVIVAFGDSITSAVHQKPDDRWHAVVLRTLQRQFAGIDIEEFSLARQRARRAVLLWTLAVMVLTGLVAAGAWTVGLNLDGLLGR